MDHNKTETDFTQNEGKTDPFCISGISTQVFYTNVISYRSNEGRDERTYFVNETRQKD